MGSLSQPLSLSVLVDYLLEDGYITPADVVASDLSLVDASSRNHNVLVLRRHQPSYIVKTNRLGTGATSYEASVYALLSQPAAGLNYLIPRVRGHDPGRGLLILELIGDSQTVASYHRRLRRPPRVVARALGRALACLHDSSRSNDAGLSHHAALPQVRPWALSLHRPTLEMYNAFSPAHIELVARIQESRELCATLDEIASSWCDECLVHLDLKWDNCLVRARPSRQPTAERVVIVDWELAGTGDPAWDLGTALANYLCLWLTSIPFEFGTGREVLERTQRPLEDLRPAMVELLSAYVAARRMLRDERARLLVRATRFAAVRLIQTAFEYLQSAADLPAEGLYFVQLAQNLADRPAEALVHLVGVDATFVG